jgi:GTPase SAR1 family protein
MASKGKWRALSETVSGLVLARVDDPKCKVGIPADAVNPASLCAPYHEIIPLARDGMDIGQISMSVGVQAVNDAIQMGKTVSPEINPLVWVQQLEKESVKAQAGYKLDPFVKALQNGDEVDMGGILKILGDLESGYQELTPMSKIDAENAVWHKTGYAPWDEHFNGLPASSLTIIGATPGVGKTTLMVELVKDMVQRKENKKKHAAIFTLEMTMGQLTQRMLDLVDLKEGDKERILMGDGCYTVHEVYAVASRAAAQHDLCVIAIDFADQMIEGEQTEATMGIIYRNLAMLAKKTGVPVLLLSQLNREAQNGEMPRIHHLRYSGLAEAMAALIILIYNPKNTAVNVNAKQVLTPAVGKGYLIVGKSRYGYVHDSPGAVMVDWNGEGGWGSKSIGWFNV